MGKTPLSPEQLNQNFADLHPNFARDEAVAASAKCLFCYDAPCMRACPTHIDVPKFIRQILHGNPGGAAETIAQQNIFGGSCGRACPVEVLCEGACVDQTLLNEPVQIGRLQRYATEWAHDRSLRFFDPGPDTGKRVAVIGSGPAGLSCAHELRRHGHSVTVFEARDVAGGLNTLGIAAYKIDTPFALKELRPILDMGMDVKLNSPVDGKKVAALLKEYDAVFLGIGLGATQRLSLPGEETPGVWEALDFVFQTHTKPYAECEVGRRVVVIGAGNTAVDCATEAVRLGAEKVTMAYRRTQREMSAYDYEYELAKADGIHFEWNAAPVEFLSAADGRLYGVRFQRVALVGTGREANMQPVPGSEFIIECDMAVKALGQMPLLDFMSAIPSLKVDRGRLVVNRETMETSVSGLYAGGDVISKGAEIVNAVQEGKIAARAITAKLTGQPMKRDSHYALEPVAAK